MSLFFKLNNPYGSVEIKLINIKIIINITFLINLIFETRIINGINIENNNIWDLIKKVIEKTIAEIDKVLLLGFFKKNKKLYIKNIKKDWNHISCANVLVQ